MNKTITMNDLEVIKDNIFNSNSNISIFNNTRQSIISEKFFKFLDSLNIDLYKHSYKDTDDHYPFNKPTSIDKFINNTSFVFSFFEININYLEENINYFEENENPDNYQELQHQKDYTTEIIHKFLDTFVGQPIHFIEDILYSYSFNDDCINYYREKSFFCLKNSEKNILNNLKKCHIKKGSHFFQYMFHHDNNIIDLNYFIQNKNKLFKNIDWEFILSKINKYQEKTSSFRIDDFHTEKSQYFVNKLIIFIINDFEPQLILDLCEENKEYFNRIAVRQLFNNNHPSLLPYKKIWDNYLTEINNNHIDINEEVYSNMILTLNLSQISQKLNVKISEVTSNLNILLNDIKNFEDFHLSSSISDNHKYHFVLLYKNEKVLSDVKQFVKFILSNKQNFEKTEAYLPLYKKHKIETKLIIKPNHNFKI